MLGQRVTPLLAFGKVNTLRRFYLQAGSEDVQVVNQLQRKVEEVPEQTTGAQLVK